jgi:hypothetical protein
MILRIAHLAAAGLLLSGGLAGSPPLTTVLDVLYKADGTRFNGSATIHWRSFETADKTAIAMHTATVKIVDGQLRVQLVPNAGVTPPAPYVVKYVSDGRIQFEETWVVPSSAKAVRLRDVRVTAPPRIEAGELPIQQSDVVGLTADLAARPVRGPGFAPGRAAVVNAMGALESAVGDPSDCVRVDGTAGPCGSGGSGVYGFTDNETPGGAVDGSNTAFSLVAAPNPPVSLTVYRNGLLQKMGQDFVLSDRTITFLSGAAPEPGDTLLASYRRFSPGTVTGPEVLCSSMGASTGGTEAAVLGACAIAAGTLAAGDRVEVRFDYSKEGTDSGFTFEVRWAGAAIVSREAGPGEALVAGRAEAAVAADGAQIAVQTWGVTLPLAAGIVAAPFAEAPGIEFLGWLAQAGSDSVGLRQFTVVRYPAGQ